MDKVKKLLENLSPSKVLDIATGVGDSITLLKDNLGSFEMITGIDIEEKAIEMARKNFDDPAIKFEVMSGESIDYKDELFDLVCLSNSIHHLHDINKAFTEMKRVTSNDGYILINEMFKDNLSEQQQTHVIFHHWSARISRMIGRVHNDTFDKATIKEILLENNLRVIDEIEFKYNEPNSKEANEKLASQVDPILDGVREKIKNHESYDEICSEAEDIKKRILDIGYQGASQYMLLCKKL